MNDILDSIVGFFSKTAEPDVKEAGPGDVGPTVQTSTQASLVSLPMTSDECSQWWTRYEAGKARIKNRAEKWDLLLREYLPIVVKSGDPETVRVQKHFRNVHTKIGQLFYRSPDLVLTVREPSPAQDQLPPAAPPLPGQPPPPPLRREDVIAIKQAILNMTLGRDAINVERLMGELLFDVLAYSGIGCSKLGYNCVFRKVPAQTPQPGAVLNLQQPAPAAQPLPIFEEFYWRKFSARKFICNPELRSTRFDEDATFLGMDFYMSPAQAMKQFGLTEDEANKAAEDSMVFKYEEDSQSSVNASQRLVHGVELWVKLSYFTDEEHPQAMGQLILIEGIKDRPIVWRKSPYQDFDEQTGQLTDDSLVGFPIRVLTIRDLTDSAFPPSDSAFTNSEVKQLSTWRRQSIAIRDANIGKFLFDASAFDDDNTDKLQNGPVGQFVAVEEGKLAEGVDKILASTPKISQTNDDYRSYAGISNEIDETLGISANQSGVQTDTIHSATEVKLFSGGANARNDKELSFVVDFYLSAVRMLDQLLMRYQTKTQWVEIEQMVGQDATKVLQAWNGKTIAGKWYYDIAPDSQMKADSAVEQQLDMNLYNTTAKDPLVSRAYVLRRIFRRRGYDPNKAVIDPTKLAQPKPVPPSISFTFKGEDLALPVVQEILMRAELLPPLNPATPPAPGGPVAHPPAVQQPPHGGPANKHEASKSGHLPNEPGVPNHRENMPV